MSRKDDLELSKGIGQNCELIRLMAESIVHLEKRTCNAENCLKNLLETLTTTGVLNKWEMEKGSYNPN